MTTFNMTEFDLIFLSYDEPNADLNWADLLDKAPWAKRVHGVKGFDAAHRACAEASETAFFITVDADNRVRPEFFDTEISFDPDREPNRCFSWNGENTVNGLAYGNGGLKLWSKSFVMTMNTHENADDPRKAVDFCWENDYKQIYQTFSDVYVNGSPYQAFRVGFREGVKLTLDRGERVSAEMMANRLHPVNLRNLRIWCSVGSHAPNGLWAVYGARLGWSRMCDLNWDHTVVRDFDWFASYWQHHEFEKLSDERLTHTCEALGEHIQQATRISIPLLDTKASGFFTECLRTRL